MFYLPKKYYFNEQNLRDGKYIDDNSLYLYFLVCNNALCRLDPVMAGIFCSPFEWSDLDYIAFQIKLCRDYGYIMDKIETEICAVKGEFETAEGFDPIYQWYLDEKLKSDLLPEVELLLKMEDGEADIDDLEQALIYATRLSSIRYDGSIEHISKKLFITFLNYTSFTVCGEGDKLSKDLNHYIELFINDELKRNTTRHYISDTQVEQPLNIAKYKYHFEELRSVLIDRYKKYGQEFILENVFDDHFPNEGRSNKDSELIRERYRARDRLFFHIILAFELQKLIEVHSIHNNWNRYEDEDYTHLCRIKVLPILINPEFVENLSFDSNKGKLHIQGKEIKLKKFGDEYHTLRVIFEDSSLIGQEWFYSEIREKIDPMSKDGDKKYYNAVYQLKTKLQKCGITDFFITTRQSVKIDKKYLS